MTGPHPDPLDPLQNLEPPAVAGAARLFGNPLTEPNELALASQVSIAISLKRMADGGGMDGEPVPAQVRFKRRSVETAVTSSFDPPKDHMTSESYVEPKALAWAIGLHFEVKDGEPQQEVARRIGLAIRMMETGR